MPNVLETTSEMSPVAGTSPAVSVGSSTPYEISRPTTMAAPTVTPTRCPTPISASDRLAPKVEPPAPSRNAADTSLLITFRAASSENPAATSEATRMARRLLRFSSAPPSECSPTLSTSAAARPSG